MGDLVFAGLAAVSVGSALLVVTRKNPVYSALFLILCFLSVAGLAVLLDASFLAGMHVLVYAGAIMVLFLFVVLLLNLKPEELGGEHSLFAKTIIFLISIGIFTAMAVVFANDPAVNLAPARIDPQDQFGTVQSIGKLMFSEYVLPFELVSVLIMIAIFGAVVLARREERRP
jgi:NADH-quinone oxidoreductase subunit J